MSFRNRLSAVMRCVSPRSITSHSVGRQDARQQIIGEDPLGAVLLTVDCERDALVQECEVGRRLPLPELGRIDLGEPLEQGRVLRAGLARPVEHLVIRPVEHVTTERRPLVERARTGLGSDGHAALVGGGQNAVKDRAEVVRQPRGMDPYTHGLFLPY